MKTKTYFEPICKCITYAPRKTILTGSDKYGAPGAAGNYDADEDNGDDYPIF